MSTIETKLVRPGETVSEVESIRSKWITPCFGRCLVSSLIDTDTLVVVVVQIRMKDWANVRHTHNGMNNVPRLGLTWVGWFVEHKCQGLDECAQRMTKTMAECNTNLDKVEHRDTMAVRRTRGNTH